MKKLALYIMVLCLGAVISAPSMAKCYSQEEAEADQAIRIHSELMVIGLTCQSIGMRHGYNLYGDYRSFTARHGVLIAGYESDLMRFYKRQGGAGDRQLNALRTKYANKISDDAAKIRPDVFCSKYAPRILKAKTMSGDHFKKWAATFYDSHPVSYPICH